MASIQRTERVSRRLRSVRLVALLDLVLLLALISAALTGQRGLVQILGPLHGINFLFLLVIVGAGALDGLWKWWFPVAVLLTAGPPGALLGEWIISRGLRGQDVVVHDAASSGIVVFTGEEGTDTSDLLLSSIEERMLDKRKEQQ